MSGRFWLISVLTLVMVLLIGFRVVLPKLAGKKTPEDWQRIQVGRTDLRVLIADEPGEMEVGLGGRGSLGKAEGMLFVYPKKVTPRFWMKGMQFDLDLIWISDSRVVEITTDVPAPKTATEDLPFFSPKEPIDGVLEVVAGGVATHGIKVGDLVTRPE